MIAVDWGSSSLRTFRLDDRGKIMEQRRSDLGVLTCQGQFERVLQQQIVGWNDPLIVLACMISSRQGWVEVPYVECPVTMGVIAAGMMNVEAPGLPNRRVWIVPGLICRTVAANATDVLRGEETQLCALMAHADSMRRIVCLPGTHSKWAIVEGGRIESFFTVMTGEVFDLLRKRSLLASLMTESLEPLDREAFRQGMAQAQKTGGVLHHLFSVRTAGLTNTLKPAQLASYLSGLLIAHELLDLPWAEEVRGQSVHLIGNPALLESYRLALLELGTAVEIHPETLAAHGAHALAQHRGLLHPCAA